jgi:3'-phosphoadenosine 5'-phosphosulfate sulfotransferase (PAPS reductase)/FAD synthetase
MDLEQKAIERLKMASEMSLRYYNQPLLCAYSGGKDSDAMLELFRRSGIPFEVQNSHTTADAPETVYHIRKVFKRLELKGIKCIIDYPKYKGERTSMWSLIPQKLMPPTRRVRYCCQVLKEGAGDGRMVATGVRWDESTQRASRGGMEIVGATKKQAIILTNDNDSKRRFFEKCEARAKSVCNPIIEWKNADIWDFIHSEKIEINPLYKCGFDRVGCIGCPMANKKRYFEFSVYPKYKQMYIKAFEKMIQERLRRGLETQWETGEEVFAWWMNEDINQLTLDLEGG